MQTPCYMKVIHYCLLGLMLGGLLACREQRLQNSQQAMFEQVWNDFQQTYPYFAHKGVDWDSVYAEAYPRFAKPLPADTFFVRLAELLLPLRDIHIVLSSPQQHLQFSKRSRYPANPPRNAAYYLDSVHFDNQRILYADLAGTDVVYLRVESLEGSVNNYIDFPTVTILSALAQKSGLIIDLRDNAGGKEDFATDFASRFMPDSRVYKQQRRRNGPETNDFNPWEPQYIGPAEPIIFDQPIVLLTNRGCYSATESFVLMMRTLPNVWVLGDTTGGASGEPLAATLANGWRYTLPTLQFATADGQLIEDQGIAPDQTVQMSEESLQAGRDMMLEEALKRF